MVLVPESKVASLLPWETLQKRTELNMTPGSCKASQETHYKLTVQSEIPCTGRPP
jgi:hypothetical protein